MNPLSPVFRFLAVLTFAAVASAANAPRPPNIVILLADDLGWGECGFQGMTHDIPTPHIDRIARDGVRFTNGYVAATYCSPSRAGCLTGRYPTRFGYEFIGRVGPGVGLPLTERTFAEYLKPLGYATCAVGKWHVGEDVAMQPTARGFDEYLGILANSGSYFAPIKFIDSLHRVTPGKDFYTTDAFADRAVDWIERNRERPFLLYLAFNAVHMPLNATERYLARFPNIADPNRRTFAGMMSAMDDAVGRVMDTLRKQGLEENTLVVFFSDNGGPVATTASNGPLRGTKSTTSEGGTRVPFAIQWKGHLPAGQVYDFPIVQLDLLPTAIVAAGGTVDPKWRLDGVDLLPFLTGREKGRPHQTLYWRFGEQWAIRDGDWKVVASRIDQNRPRLIDLAHDVAEAHDLAAEQPERLRALTAKWQAWSAEQQPPAWRDAPGGEDGAAKQKKKKKAGE